MQVIALIDAMGERETGTSLRSARHPQTRVGSYLDVAPCVAGATEIASAST
jgi:hypothetical protein